MATLNDASISSVRDLADAMDTFLVAQSFTQDTAPTGTTTGSAAWTIGDVHVQMSWDSQTHFDLEQSSAFPVSTTNSGHTSQVDFDGVSLSTAEVWGFTNSGTATDRYAHFVVEFNRDGRFVHFGFGHIEKAAAWTGGAYKYGGQWDNTSDAEKEPWNAGHRVLLDGNNTNSGTANNLATMTISGMTGQPASGAFTIFTNSTSAPGNDGAGNGVMKTEGYVRHGPWPSTLLPFPAAPNNAQLPLVPIDCAAHTGTGNVTTRYHLGRMRDVRVVNMGSIAAKAQITDGDTWQFFPWAQKLTNDGTDVLASRNFGVAYKVI